MPTPTQVRGERCPERGYRSLIVGTSDEELAERVADHRARCHPAGRAEAPPRDADEPGVATGRSSARLQRDIDGI